MCDNPSNHSIQRTRASHSAGAVIVAQWRLAPLMLGVGCYEQAL